MSLSLYDPTIEWLLLLTAVLCSDENHGQSFIENRNHSRCSRIPLIGSRETLFEEVERQPFAHMGTCTTGSSFQI